MIFLFKSIDMSEALGWFAIMLIALKYLNSNKGTVAETVDETVTDLWQSMRYPFGANQVDVLDSDNNMKTTALQGGSFCSSKQMARKIWRGMVSSENELDLSRWRHGGEQPTSTQNGNRAPMDDEQAASLYSLLKS